MVSFPLRAIVQRARHTVYSLRLLAISDSGASLGPIGPDAAVGLLFRPSQGRLMYTIRDWIPSCFHAPFR